ncbi:RNA polymerase sigma-70 factor (ECF subfamily) [Novosphingobium kunmingense]|uniref:RNA polymerase sigma-70 factor (ECF subfamily) n=2 Tax=Novosphingobium kunmingense TaxID=1211806 RepID=A0A2N0HKE3_9SPHN|nr:sigma-70 family RNA polymerase sigma factor [Novosphingobium kunmingense]PKB19369.1 RNA polymerase sigma-70 factor (ECF subfamily) [Novosphingobium kunmingense]
MLDNKSDMTATADNHEALDDATFKASLAAVTPHLRAFARTLSGCRERADDLAQETLLKAWSARASYRAGTNFKAWTFTILRNHFYSEARRARFTGEYDQDMAERTLRTFGNQEDSLELADVARALQTLPATHRDALILVAIGDLSYDAIAEVCGIALGTVKSRICRARAMLASVLESGQLPDARHDFVMEGDAIDLMFEELRRVSNNNSAQRVAA